MKKVFIVLSVLSLILISCKTNVHTHTYSDTWSFDEENHWHAATCEHTDEIKDKAEHTFGEWTVTIRPTEEAEGLRERECSVCKYKAEETVAKLEHTHKFASVYSSDTKYHWHAATCEHTDELKDKAEHTFGEWTVTIRSTEEAEGLRERECSVCKYKAEETVAKLEHTHKFASVYSSSTTHHWHAATCEHTDEIKDKAEHTFGEWTVTIQSTEEAEGLRERECSECKYKTEETVAKLEHVHAKGTYHSEVLGNCTTKGTLAYYDCVKESCIVKLDANTNPLSSIEGTLNPSFHTGTISWIRDTNFHKAIYNCCGAVKVISTSHRWDEGIVTTQATEDTTGVKTYTCTICSMTKTERITKLFPLKLKKYMTPVDKNGNAATAASEEIYFGVFPKTIKASDVTIDETKTLKMGLNTYYKGSDGEYYAKIQENQLERGGETYSDGTKAQKSIAYFKVEPIKWGVHSLNYNGTNKVLLFAKDILTAYIPYYKFNKYDNSRTVGEDTNIYPSNYKYSQIRAFLNGLDYYYDTSETETTRNTKYKGKGFLQTAFTSDAQDLIAVTIVDNSAKSTTDADNNLPHNPVYACDDTEDKIFLLSENEVTDSAYGFLPYQRYDKNRIRITTDYAKATGANQSATNGYGGRWWLRTPSSSSSYARYVTAMGSASANAGVNVLDVGIVPALTIDLQ